MTNSLWRKRQEPEALKLALEAITQYLAECPDPSEEAVEGLCDAASFAREALAQPEPYDQTALELCNVCGWKTLIPDDACLNCERAQPEQEQHARDAVTWTPETGYVFAPQPKEPEQKYRRGNRLICLETDEYCVIHISGTDRQWVKFPDSHIGVYTNEQVAELFELLPKEPEQEPVAHLLMKNGKKESFWFDKKDAYDIDLSQGYEWVDLYTTPPQRKPLTDEQIQKCMKQAYATVQGRQLEHAFARAIEAAHGIKEKNNVVL